MRHATLREGLSVATAALVCLVLSGAAVSAQVLDNSGGKDLPRPTNYATPLAPAVAFVGPGGKNKDRVYVVDAAGNVTILTVK
jgi:hypothetical protein